MRDKAGTVDGEVEWLGLIQPALHQEAMPEPEHRRREARFPEHARPAQRRRPMRAKPGEAQQEAAARTLQKKLATLLLRVCRRRLGVALQIPPCAARNLAERRHRRSREVLHPGCETVVWGRRAEHQFVELHAVSRRGAPALDDCRAGGSAGKIMV